jgi:hypothetical protein
MTAHLVHMIAMLPVLPVIPVIIRLNITISRKRLQHHQREQESLPTVGLLLSATWFWLLPPSNVMSNGCHGGEGEEVRRVRFGPGLWPGPRRQALGRHRLRRSRGSRRSFLRSEGYYQPQAAQNAAPEMEL